MTEINENTYIRKLPYSAIHKLISLLEPGQLWKQLVVNIPKRLHSAEFEERYSDIQIRMIEEKGKKPNTYSTRVILDDWGTQNATVKNLLLALTKSRLYAAADYISVNVLKGEQVPRQAEDIVFTGGTLLQQSLERLNLEQCTPEKSGLYNKDKISASASSSTGNISFVSGSDSSNQPSSYIRDQVSSQIDGSLLYSRESQHNSVPTYFQGKRNPEQSHSHLSQDNSVNGEVMSNRMEPYSSGNMLQDLKGAPQVIPSLERETDLVSDTVEEIQKKDEPCSFDFQSQEIKYSVLKLYTDNFSDKKLSEGGKVIGWGGFGTVYLATFPNRYKVAVKRLKNTADPIMQKQFETELKTLSAYKHENIVQLVGYSIDGQDKCLVYEYMVNGSLEDRLQCLNGTAPLPWQLRVNIAYGTAKGIVYLNDQGLVHRDIKSANVLLDENFVPKVGDFATTRLAPSGCGSTIANTTLVIGTSAYMAPEAIRFDISAKLDSFAFGVVMLELLTGLPPNDSSREEQDLWSHVAENCDESILEMLDKTAGSWVEKTADAIFDIALRCLKDRKKERIIVKDVLDELKSLVPN